MKRHVMMALVALGALSAATPALAQEEREFEGPLQEQLREYWSVERELTVVRERLFSREGKIELGLMTGLMSSDPFYWYVPLGGRIGYSLTEHLALEIEGNYALANNTELHDFLISEREDSFNSDTDLGDRFTWQASALVVWRPLYGKWAALQRKLSHLDFNLSLGVGAIGLTRPNPLRTASESTITPNLTFGAGLAFWLAEGLSLRVDGRGYLYAGPEFKTQQFAPQDAEGNVEGHGFFQRLSLPSQFLVGVSYAF